MLYLLNPRLWLIAGIVAALAFSHIYVYRKGAANVRAEWTLATAKANSEALRLERARQSAADAAGRAAASRASVLRADAARAGDALSRLRDAIAAGRVAEESRDAAVVRANRIGELLQSCGAEYQEMARRADAHVNDLRQHREAWPQ